MKTTNRFDRAISALVKGYFNNTLVKGNCYACAVGNICATAVGAEVIKMTSPDGFGRHPLTWLDKYTLWQSVFTTVENQGQKTNPERYKGKAKEQIDATGYSWQELAKVEKAFEEATKIHWQHYRFHTPEQIDADQYAGLCAVVDTLCQIEGISDASDQYKALFAGKALQEH